MHCSLIKLKGACKDKSVLPRLSAMQLGLFQFNMAFHTQACFSGSSRSNFCSSHDKRMTQRTVYVYDIWTVNHQHLIRLYKYK